MSNELIRVEQLPIVESVDALREVKARWMQEAEIARQMVCDEQTVVEVKKALAELRKEFDALDKQRKTAKKQYLAPWESMESAYRECIADGFREAENIYRRKIAEVENAQREQCEKRLREYFSELCAVHSLPWLRYEQAGVRISLTEAKKKTPSGHMNALSEFVARVACDVDAIGDDAELMAEYKESALNLAKARIIVRDRREAQEAERKAAEERTERQRREAEAVAMVEAAASAMAPPVAAEVPKEEKLLTVTFRATGTRAQLIKVREFMKQVGIAYE